jgi:hypothetical protein
MFLLVFLRYLLGKLPGAATEGKPAFSFGETTFREMLLSAHSIRAAQLWVAPHQWMSMDYVLSEGPPGSALQGRGAFSRANHFLPFVFSLARRLACWPESYLVMPATVSVCNLPPHRLPPDWSRA